MIHCSSEPVAPRSSTIDGSATFRIVLSTPITINERHSTAEGPPAPLVGRVGGG